MAAKGLPKNTKRINEWALKTFYQWISAQNSSQTDDIVPDDLLSSEDTTLVAKWLCKFVLEVRLESGSHYPPKSIYSLLCGLYRISRSNGVSFNFLDKKDHRFIHFRNTLDTVCSQLHSKGVGSSVKSAAVMSFDDEDALWDRKVMSMDDPSSLLNLIFFYVGLHCCLRGGQEHRDLSVDQFRRYPSDTTHYDGHTYYEYAECISKNNQHRFNDIHSKNKVVKVFAIVGSNRCFVKIMDFYLAKLPAEPKSFYLLPLTKAPDDTTKPWFVKCCCGCKHNTLNDA